MPGQFVPSPKNPTPRRGGSRVPRTGPEESGPLSGPRQIALRVMYKSPPRTSSAPSPIRNILASPFIAAAHNRTGIQADGGRIVPAAGTIVAVGFLIVRPELTCGASPQSAPFQDRRPDPRLLSVTESVALPPVLVGARAMPEIQKSILPPRQTTRPRCSVCQSRMEIQRIAKARAGFEHWTLRCIRCGHIDQVQVNVAPLKSEAQGWFKS